MTAAQGLFLLALTALLVGIAAFGILVIAAAARTTGTAGLTGEIARRIGRSPSDRLDLGRWGYYAHRISGLAIFVFLGLHVADVSLFTVSPELYDEVHRLYATPPLRIFESGLLVAILFHTFNGLRLVVIDLTDVGPKAVSRMLVGVLVATAVLGAAGTAVILAPIMP